MAGKGRRSTHTLEDGDVAAPPRVLVVAEEPRPAELDYIIEALRGAGLPVQTVRAPAHGRDGGVPVEARDFDVVVMRPVTSRAHRSPAHDGNLPDVVVGRLKIDAQRRVVEIDSQIVRMSAREFTLLHYLASRPNVVFSREALLDAVWGSSWRTEGSVTEYVRRVRMILGPYGLGHCIVTRKGFGYAFDPEGAE